MAIPATTDRANRKPNALYWPTKYTEGDKLGGYMHGVPFAAYKAAGALSKYDISKFLRKTPYRYFNEEEKPQGKDALIATALRALIFDPLNCDKKYTLLPEVKDRRQSEYKTAIKALGVDCVFVGDEAKGIIGMRDAIMGNDESKAALESNAMTQVTGFHKHAETGLLLRTKMDKIVGKEAFIIKPVSSAADKDISNTMLSASYHIEAAMCIDGHRVITGDDLDFVKFILVEKTFPYQVAIVYLDDISILVGRDSYVNALSDYKKSLDNPLLINNNTPSFMTSIPEYAMRDYDDIV